MESCSSKRNADEQSAAPPDAKKIKEEQSPQRERLCAGCHQDKNNIEFSKGQKKRGAAARCKSCIQQSCMHQGDVGGAKSNQQQQHQQQQQMVCCASCQVNKSIASFSKKERNRRAEARCMECSEREGKQAQQERQKAERERQEALRDQREAEHRELARITDLKDKARLAANGAQIKMPTFEVPGLGFGGQWGEDDGYTCPEMVFHQSPTTFESLVGSYDLIFYHTYGDGDEIQANRVTKGSLDFTMDEATGELTGSVAIDKSVKNAIWYHQFDSKITCESEIGSLSFQVTNMDELENLCEDEVSGTIQRVSKRQAVRYTPEGLDSIDYQKEYARSIQFENETEAQSILDNYARGNEPILWLSNHMQFPEQVSSLVGGFATCKPPPIFFFEEDDLWLKYEWDPSHHGNDFGTTLVARRRR